MTWRPFITREYADSEQRQELDSYLEIAADEFAARGMSPAEARHAARLKLGNPTLIQEEIYNMQTHTLLDALHRHLRQTARALRRNPTFAGIAILTLALAIGANTAVFTVVNSVLLRPLPYPHSEELVALRQAAPGAAGLASLSGGLNLSASMYFIYAEQNRTFRSLGVWQPGIAAVNGLAEPEQVRTIMVSDGALQALSVQPALGRSLTSADQSLSSTETVMLSYGYWQRRFGGDTRVIGRTLSVDARPREIAGVLAPGFRIADTAADLILPIRFDRSRVFLAGFSFQGVGRLKAGVSLDQANADLARLIPVWMNSWPSIGGGKSGDPIAQRVYEAWRIAPALRPLRDDVVGKIGTLLWIVMGTLGMVMLIACANVANLLLVRAEARRQELGVRAALGAGWARIAGGLLLESVVLACAGGVLGTCFAYAGLRLLLRIGPANLPRLTEISLDVRSLGFTVAVSMLSGLLFGLVPALRHATRGIATSLRAEGRASTGSREHNRARNILLMAQVALALVLLIGSSLMVRTFQALHHVDPGFTRPGQLQTFRVAIPKAMVAAPEMVTRTEDAILEKLRAIPGVTSAAFASALPMDGSPPNWDAVLAEGKTYNPGDPMVMRLFRNVSPGFFHATGTRLSAGRDFTWNDLYSLRPYVMVSDNMARELWGSPSQAIGKRFRSNPAASWREVIGVVQDVRHNGVNEPAPATIYWPALQEVPFVVKAVESTGAAAFVVRSDRAGGAGLLDEIHRAVWSVNAGIPLAEERTLAAIYDSSLARTSFTLVMLAIAGSMALVLGVVGNYGVVACIVAQRRREVGIRMALGARPESVTRMFVRYGLALSTAGVVIGIAAAAGLSRLMSSLLFGVTSLDPVTYAGAALFLLAAATVASYIPALRATAVNPMETLRAE